MRWILFLIFFFSATFCYAEQSNQQYDAICYPEPSNHQNAPKEEISRTGIIISPGNDNKVYYFVNMSGVHYRREGDKKTIESVPGKIFFGGIDGTEEVVIPVDGLSEIRFGSLCKEDAEGHKRIFEVETISKDGTKEQRDVTYPVIIDFGVIYGNLREFPVTTEFVDGNLLGRTIQFCKCRLNVTTEQKQTRVE